MIKVLKYMVIEYTNEDLTYIDSFVDELNRVSEEIVNFLNIKDFGDKVNVVLNDKLENFWQKYIETGYPLEEDGTVPKWTCGFADGNKVETLCLSEYRKTKSHENASIVDLLHLILHEFTHACHNKVMVDQNKYYVWFSEGLATTISHQYDNSDLIFNATIDQIKDGMVDYRNYHTMFKYVLETYGKEYVLKLIKDYDLLVRHTPILFNEVKQNYNQTK